MKIKIGYFRGVNFTSPVGVTDWRIMLFFRDLGFEPWVFGRREKPQRIHYDGINIVAPNIRLYPFITALFLSVCYALEALRLKLNVVVCNPGVFLGGLLVKLLSPRTKVILDIRSIPVESEGLRKRYSDSFQNLAFRLNFFDAVTVISDRMLEDLDTRYHFSDHFPTFTWASGYDEGLFHPYSPINNVKALESINEIFTIVFHGSLSPTRGLDRMIHALYILEEKNIQDIALVLIGSGAAESELRKLVKDLSLEKQVLFIPPMLQEELPPYLSHADLGIDLLPDHPWWRDQSPLKVYEFLGMGIPVLATDLPCHRDISEAVILIPDNHPETIAAKIEILINDQNLKNLRSVAIEDAKMHTWKPRAETLSAFIMNEVL